MIPIAGPFSFIRSPIKSERSTSWKADNLAMAETTRRFIISPADAQVFHQNLRLPDERARFGTGRPLSHRTRLRTRRERIGRRRDTTEHVQRSRYGRPKSARQNGYAGPARKRTAADRFWFSR